MDQVQFNPFNRSTTSTATFGCVTRLHTRTRLHTTPHTPHCVCIHTVHLPRWTHGFGLRCRFTPRLHTTARIRGLPVATHSREGRPVAWLPFTAHTPVGWLLYGSRTTHTHAPRTPRTTCRLFIRVCYRTFTRVGCCCLVRWVLDHHLRGSTAPFTVTHSAHAHHTTHTPHTGCYAHIHILGSPTLPVVRTAHTPHLHRVHTHVYYTTLRLFTHLHHFLTLFPAHTVLHTTVYIYSLFVRTHTTHYGSGTTHLRFPVTFRFGLYTHAHTHHLYFRHTFTTPVLHILVYVLRLLFAFLITHTRRFWFYCRTVALYTHTLCTDLRYRFTVPATLPSVYGSDIPGWFTFTGYLHLHVYHTHVGL